MCDCNCHENEKWSYRVILGNKYEGLSIREVVYDKKGHVVGWNPTPLHDPVSTLADVRKCLVEDMKAIDEMLEATKEPILDEAKLERGLR